MIETLNRTSCPLKIYLLVQGLAVTPVGMESVTDVIDETTKSEAASARS